MRLLSGEKPLLFDQESQPDFKAREYLHRWWPRVEISSKEWLSPDNCTSADSQVARADTSSTDSASAMHVAGQRRQREQTKISRSKHH